MPNVLIARLSGTGKELVVEQPEMPQRIFSILSRHFGGSMETGYTPNDAFLEDVPHEVVTHLKKLFCANRTLGIILYGHDVDSHGFASHNNLNYPREDFPIQEGLLVVAFRKKFYVLAQWRSDNRAPTPISEMKQKLQERFERSIAADIQLFRECDEQPFTFAP